ILAPPHTSISAPVHTDTYPLTSALGALVVLIAVQVSFAGFQRPPTLVLRSGWLKPHTINSWPVQAVASSQVQPAGLGSAAMLIAVHVAVEGLYRSPVILLAPGGAHRINSAPVHIAKGDWCRMGKSGTAIELHVSSAQELPGVICER